MRPGVGHAVRTGYPDDDDDDDEEESAIVDGLLDLVRWEEHVYSIRIHFYTCVVTFCRSVSFLVHSVLSAIESKMTMINIHLESHLFMFFPMSGVVQSSISITLCFWYDESCISCVYKLIYVYCL